MTSPFGAVHNTTGYLMDMPFSHLLTGSLLRAMELIPLILVMGWLGFLAVVFRSDGLGVRLNEGWRLAQRWDRWLSRGALGLILVAMVVGFGHQSMMMSRRALDELGPILWPILTRTHLGHVVIAQSLLWIGLAWVWNRDRTVPAAPARRTNLLLGLGALFCLTQSLTGHAADQGNWSVEVLADWLHLLAVSFWAGGVVVLALLVPALMNRCQPAEARALLIRALQRFSPFAMCCVAVLVAAGLFTASRRGVTVTEPFASTYGQWVARKVVLTAVAVGLGGVSRFVILPALRRKAEKTEPARRFRRAIAVEAGVVVIIMLLAAVLTQTPPSGNVSMTSGPMHHGHTDDSPAKGSPEKDSMMEGMHH